MKNRLYTQFRLGVIFLLAAVFTTVVTSCDTSRLSDAIDDFDVVIGLEPINTVSSVLITDAGSGELISDQIKITFDGQNSSDVIDIYSDPLPSETTEDGIVNFGISNSISPSESSPATVELILEAEGYLPTTKRVVIKEQGLNEFSFELVKESAPPAGVKKQSAQAQTNSDGSVSQEVTIETDNSSTNDDAGASVTVPEGTIFRDSGGNALSGELTTEFTNFDPGDAESLNAFPFEAEQEPGEQIEVGGISILEVRDENGNVAASTAAAKSKDGHTLQNAGKITFTYRLSSYYNAQPGDLVSFYTFAVTSNSPFRYSFDRFDDIPVEDLGNGQVGVRIQVENYPRAICVFRVISNPQPVTITLDRNGHTGTAWGYFSTYGSYNSLRYSSSQNSVTLANVSSDRDYRVRFYSPTYHYETVRISGQSEIDVTLPAPSANVIDANINVTLRCVNQNEKVSVTDIPGATVIYRKAEAPGGTRWKYGRNLAWNYDEDTQELTGGKFAVEQVEEDADYTFLIYFDGNRYSRTITIDGADVTYIEEIDEDICS